MLIKVSMINSVLLKILRFLTPAAPRAEWSTWSPATAAIKIASIVLSIPGCETLSCSAIAIIAAPTIRTSTQERWYSPHCTKVALGSGKMSFPATNRTRIYAKPGKYLSRLLLSAPRTCAAVVALLASGPSAVLAEVLAIIASHKQMGRHTLGKRRHARALLQRE